ncbi:lycopene cyclase family protein [Actinoalloteichus sp. GBA129-24]|uniref:Lycopene cyclase family protein n=1 Tax=Actinoalloteichus fjordicus TaxID=1612552 RepID=A0AAC9LE02_9PSEU|nr:lycopene cyclase family protein [Actinoalloteichus sp. GBA129-24]APU14575.1 lycopene cyclase family protein [Actinoalloteichus fjordicus]APU20543.1 lycopene cyclase family protein [Actinoalloteichus sp. GBA129-24]
MVDVLIAGAGPAGLALACACVDAGLSVTVADPAGDRPWRASYGLWRDELPGLPDHLVAARASTAVVVTDARRRLDDREYCVLDNLALRAELARPEITLRRGRVRGVEHHPHGSTIGLSDGTSIEAGLLVDATGTRARAGGPTSAQTAFGLVLPAAATRGYLGPGEAMFMDWRAPSPAETAGSPPSFCYAVPLGADEVLIEETCLAGRPAASIGELRTRLATRLAGHGVDVGRAHRQERVWIDLDRSPRRPRRVLSFGAAAGLGHPATGYGLAAALRLAPATAAALATHRTHGPAAAVKAAHRASWPVQASLVHALRRYGLKALLTLDQDECAAFFTAFFRLPSELRAAYLSDREDTVATSRAMIALLSLVPAPTRWRLISGGRSAMTPRRSLGAQRHAV